MPFPGDVAERPDAHRKIPGLAPQRERHFQLPQRYEVQGLISSGAYGSVREAYDRDEQRRVAIKRTAHVFSDPVECAGILGDIAILSRLKHDSIMRVFDLITPHGANRLDEVYVVMEVCDTDMRRLLQTNVALDYLQINTLLYNLMLGLNYLHSIRICHMDLRPSNCLMNQDCSVKISDFSAARVICEESQHTVKTRRNSRTYQAPELMLPYVKPTEAIDVWSVGCIYAELLQMLPGIDFASRKPLFRRPSASQHGSQDRFGMIFQLLGTPEETEIESVESEELKRYLRAFSPYAGDGLHAQFPLVHADSLEILEQFLKFMPEQRITMAGALQHKLVANVRDETKEVLATERITLPFASGQDLDEGFLRKQFSKALQMYHPSCL